MASSIWVSLQIPVAEGSAAPLSGVVKAVASFVHGDDGFGNTNQTIIQVHQYLSHITPALDQWLLTAAFLVLPANFSVVLLADEIQGNFLLFACLWHCLEGE